MTKRELNAVMEVREMLQVADRWLLSGQSWKDTQYVIQRALKLLASVLEEK